MATGPAEKPTRKENGAFSGKKQKTARKKEEEVFLAPPDTLCVQCKKELCDPHLLCCMHSVCRECLLAVKQQDGRLQCPKCNNNATCALEDPPCGMKTCEEVRSQCVPVRNGPLCRIKERLDPKPVSFTLTTLDNSRVACSGGGERVQAFLRPARPLPGVAIRAEVEDSGGGQYQVVFRVVYTGKCELSVLVNGEHIKGSPFTVRFEDGPPVFLQGQWMSEKSTQEIQKLQANKGVLNFPQQLYIIWGMAVSPNGTCFVSDRNSSLIHVFDAERNRVRTFGQPGTGAGQLSYPSGLATTADGLLFVANYGNQCVDIFREDGTFIRRIGQGQLSGPIDVAVHANGQVYVADYGNHRVTVLTQDGQLVRTFGSQGSSAGQFRTPQGIAVSPDGQVYVSDYRNSNGRVQVFTADGTYIRAFGLGQLIGPRGITFTTQGNVVVASCGNSRVSFFNPEGQLVHTLNVARALYTICFDQNGDLLVAEDRQVEIF